MYNIDDFFNLVDRGRDGKNKALPLGLPKLENYIDGLTNGTSYLIGASSGTGKSSFTLYSFVYYPIMHSTEEEYHAIMFNIEMTTEQVLSKLLSIYLYETYGEIISFKELFSRGTNTRLSDEKYELIKECKEVIQKFIDRITFYDGSLTVESFMDNMNKELKKYGTFNGDTYIPNNPDMTLGVIIDHLNLIKKSKGKSKKECIDELSNISVQIRNKTKIVSPILIMQLNRNSSDSERLRQGLQEPTVDDLKETGTVNEDTQVTLLLFNPTAAKLSSHRGYEAKKMDNRYISILCLKNRFGISGVADGAVYYGEICTFRELPKSSEINDYQKYTSPHWLLKKEELDIPSNTDSPKTKLTFKL